MRIALLALAFGLLAAPSAGAANGPSGKLLAGSEETVLRLHDLPPGYRIGDDSGCDALYPASDRGGDARRRRLLRWILRYWPEACTYQYEQLFTVPKLGPAPPLVEAATINTPSDAAAASGLKILVELLDHGARVAAKPVAISPSGVKGLLIHARELVQGQANQPATTVLWRSGKLIAVVSAAGDGRHRDDTAARRFAGIQQGRLEAPTPYAEAEQDDTEVPLDDPDLVVPVYWLGRTFEPVGGLPPTELEAAYTRDELPGEKVALWYEGFTLDAWTEASWKKLTASRLGPVNLHDRCTTKEALALEGGSAEIYAGFEGKLRHCPSRQPERFYAIARLGGMVIGVGLSNCLECRPGVSGDYGSRRAMVAILRALTPRPQPVY